MASSSSTHNLPQHHLLFPHGATAAPPPTPSSQPNVLDSPSDSAVDALASLLHRLPTTLSLPSSRFSRQKSSSTTNTTRVDAPTISLSDTRSEILTAIASAASNQGFFQLTHHRLTTQLAEAAESDSVKILALSLDQKHRLFPSNWPVGFEDDEDDQNASLCLDIDSLTSIKLPELSVASLTEFTTELESLGVELVEMLMCALSLVNPVRADEPEKRSSLMWVSKFDQNSKTVKRYPYAVGLRFQSRSQEYRVETDTGPVLVNPEVGSVLVTLGDVAQVWSNGKTKKVRGRPFPTTNQDTITMSLLITLPLDSTISPLLPATRLNDDKDLVVNTKKAEGDDPQGEKMGFKFNPISFEDYAWRVYHERLFLKDSLDRYRILSD